MQAHAQKYSKAYASDVKRGTAYTFWAKDFDAMAVKTMLRQLLSKWGVMSLEMQKAEEADGAAITASGEIEYIDSPDADPQPMPAAPQTVESPAEPEPDPVDEDDEPLDDFAAIMEG